MKNYLRMLKLLFAMKSKKESFLLVSLNEDKAKELAQVVTNDTCRKILDYLADNDSTESEIAKEMSLPISTVHYNLQQLIKGGLVVVDEFHYSEKGKEVNHYKLANKYIIIAPKSTWGLKEKLKKVLPITGVVLAATVAIEFAKRIFMAGGSNFAASKEMVLDSAIDSGLGPGKAMAVESAGDMVASGVTGGDIVAMGAEEAVRETAPEVTRMVVEQSTSNPIWQYAALWFLVGGMFAILIYLVVDWMRKK